MHLSNTPLVMSTPNFLTRHVAVSTGSLLSQRQTIWLGRLLHRRSTDLWISYAMSSPVISRLASFVTSNLSGTWDLHRVKALIPILATAETRAYAPLAVTAGMRGNGILMLFLGDFLSN